MEFLAVIAGILLAVGVVAVLNEWVFGEPGSW
jgi:hypothetical protein